MTKLFRSRRDRKITGLCGGLAETLNIDSNLLRLLLVITAFFSGGVVIPLYFLAVLVIPSEPYPGGPYGPGPGFGYGDWKGAEASYGREWGSRSWRKQRRCGHSYDHGDPREYGHEGPSGGAYQGQGQSAGSNLDDMMKDIEKKAMWKEIEDLRAKVAQYEKQQTKGDV